MKFCILICCIIFCSTLSAQKIDKETLYPTAQKIKAKWPKKYGWPEIVFNECLEGNCMEGEGTRLTYNRMIMEDSRYYLFFTLSKGKFEQQGKVVTGKRYDFKLHFTTDDKKNLVPAGGYDFSDPAFLEKHFLGDGRSANGKWDGEVKTAAFAKRFPDVKVRKLVYADDQLQWMDVDLPAGHRFNSFKGRTFVSGDFLSGKATLANGDVYEGFFFNNDFYGTGKLTTKNGKTKQGIWQFDSLLIDTPIELASFLTEEALPGKAATDYNFKTWLFGEENSNPDFYGAPVVNNTANGWGLSKFYWRQQSNHMEGIVYGQWKDNKLDGPGIIVVTPAFYQLRYGAHNGNSRFNDLNWYAGIFKNGELVQGTRIYTNYTTYANKGMTETELHKISLDNGILVLTGKFRDKYALQGCGMRQKSYGLDQRGRFTPNDILEGKFADNNNVTGYYFENDKDRTRKLEALRYTAPHILTEAIVKVAEADNDFCIDAIRTLKPQYIAGMRKKLQADIAAAEEAKKPPPPFDPYAHLPAETRITATSADYAKVDWDALGYKAEAEQTTREHIAFLEEVSKDVRKYLNETYTRNGSNYKRYARSRLMNTNSTFVHSGQDIQIAGTKVPIIILHYCQRAGSDAKAKVSVSYEGKKLENNQVLTGNNCNMETQCSNRICKTTCTGAFEFDKFTNHFYTLWLERTGNWSGSRMFWVVLRDESATK